MHSCKRCLLLVVTLSGIAAFGQVADRFDGPLVISGGGVWDSVSTDSALISLEVVPDAGRAGGALRLIDADMNAAVGSWAQLYRNISASPGPTFIQKVWFRDLTRPAAGSGSFSLIAVHSQTVGKTIAEVWWNWGTQQLTMMCFSRNSTTFNPPGSSATDGGWHLLELEVANMGTATTSCQLRVDAVTIATQNNINWSGGNVFGSALVGELYGNGEFVGSFDLDGYSEATAPGAVALQWVAPVSPVVNTCEPLTLNLIAAAGNRVGHAVDVSVQVDVIDAGSFELFNDPACATLVSSPYVTNVSAGVDQLLLSVRAAQPQIVTLVATSPDLLPDTTSLVFPPSDAGADGGAPAVDAGMGTDAGASSDAGTSSDAGAPDDAGRADAGEADAGAPSLDAATTGEGDDGGSGPRQRRLEVGCSCGASEATVLPALALALALRRRSRR